MRKLLKHQKLERFLNLSRNLYLDDGIYSLAKGVDMAITDEVWLAVIGLRNVGKSVGNELDDFNKV